MFLLMGRAFHLTPLSRGHAARVLQARLEGHGLAYEINDSDCPVVQLILVHQLDHQGHEAPGELGSRRTLRVVRPEPVYGWVGYRGKGITDTGIENPQAPSRTVVSEFERYDRTASSS